MSRLAEELMSNVNLVLYVSYLLLFRDRKRSAALQEYLNSLPDSSKLENVFNRAIKVMIQFFIHFVLPLAAKIL